MEIKIKGEIKDSDFQKVKKYIEDLKKVFTWFNISTGYEEVKTINE